MSCVSSGSNINVFKTMLFFILFFFFRTREHNKSMEHGFEKASFLVTTNTDFHGDRMPRCKIKKKKKHMSVQHSQNNHFTLT